MPTGRQLAALIGVLIVAASIGWAGAESLAGDATPPPPAPTAQAAVAAADPAPPEEALLAAAPPAPAPAPAPPAPSPETAPAPTAPAPPTPPTAPTRPRTPPAPVTTAPDPEPAPQPEPQPEPEPTPVPPAGPPASALAEQPDPPQGVAIPPGAAPTGADAAHHLLAEALSRAPEGSTDAADIRRALALWKAYLGPDAVPAPEARRATVARALRANAWWYASRDAPASRVLLRDTDGVLLTYRAGQGFVVNPVATTGRWRDLNDDVAAPALADVLLTMGVPRAGDGRRFLAWEYYDVADDPSAIRPGVSGMAQARVALLLAHADAETGDARYAEAALRALAALAVRVDDGGARSMVRTDPAQEPLPWYVERAYPGEDPWKGAALNGFMVTILNLRGAAALLEGSPGAAPEARAAARQARSLADTGARTLQRHLPDHDTGAWSLYGLLTPGRPWRTYLADLNYHCYHVRLLGQLAGAYPDLGFAGVAATWQGYVDSAGLTCPARPEG